MTHPPEEFTAEIKNLFLDKQLEQARERLLATLHQGWNGHHNLIAMTHLYANPRTAEDEQAAMAWLEKGVKAGEVDCEVILGRLWVSGELGEVRFKQGLALLESAANRGVLMAVSTLLQIHEYGVEGHCQADADKARHYLHKAADLGDPNAAYKFALLLEQSEPGNPGAAFRYFDKAAQGGLAQAMHNVAVYYLHGKGMPANSQLALAYFTEAARLASPLSMLSLALMHVDGNGIEANQGVALSWLYIYQTLFAQSSVPEQLQTLLIDVQPEQEAFARQAAQNFLRYQLKQSPGGTIH
jgi:uncharacterized protein